MLESAGMSDRSYLVSIFRTSLSNFVVYSVATEEGSMFQ